MENRSERVVLETDRHRVTGTVTLPREGYRSRLSDFLNRGDSDFVAVTDVELEPIEGGVTLSLPFVAVSRRHVRLAHPVNGQ